jgi:hypothetical protein
MDKRTDGKGEQNKFLAAYLHTPQNTDWERECEEVQLAESEKDSKSIIVNNDNGLMVWANNTRTY